MKKTVKTVLVFLAATGICSAKRHSRELKLERYERRAKEAAKENTPLSKALSTRTKSMSREEAALALEHYRKEKTTEMVIKCGERLLAVGGDQAAMLPIAEAYLEQEKYSEAEKNALGYLTHYPGADDAKHASFIAIKSLYLSQCDSYRDQRKTLDTIEQGELYLKKYPTDTLHTKEIEDILAKSYLKVVRNEMNIVENQINMFLYANRKNALKGAHKRIELIKKQYMGHAPQTRRKLVELELSLAQTEGDKEVVAQKKAELAQLTKIPRLALEEPTTHWERFKELFIEDNQKYFA